MSVEYTNDRPRELGWLEKEFANANKRVHLSIASVESTPAPTCAQEEHDACACAGAQQ